MLPEIFSCAQNDSLVIINVLRSDVGVKNNTYVRGVSLLLRVLKLVPT